MSDDKFLKPMEGRKKKSKKRLNPNRQDDSSSEDSAASGMSDQDVESAETEKSKRLAKEQEMRKRMEREKAKMLGKSKKTLITAPVPGAVPQKQLQGKKSVAPSRIRTPISKQPTLTPLDTEKQRQASGAGKAEPETTKKSITDKVPGPSGLRSSEDKKRGSDGSKSDEGAQGMYITDDGILVLEGVDMSEFNKPTSAEKIAEKAKQPEKVQPEASVRKSLEEAPLEDWSEGPSDAERTNIDGVSPGGEKKLSADSSGSGAGGEKKQSADSSGAPGGEKKKSADSSGAPGGEKKLSSDASKPALGGKKKPGQVLVPGQTAPGEKKVSDGIPGKVKFGEKKLSTEAAGSPQSTTGEKKLSDDLSGPVGQQKLPADTSGEVKSLEKKLSGDTSGQVKGLEKKLSSDISGEPPTGGKGLSGPEQEKKKRGSGSADGIPVETGKEDVRSASSGEKLGDKEMKEGEELKKGPGGEKDRGRRKMSEDDDVDVDDEEILKQQAIMKRKSTAGTIMGKKDGQDADLMDWLNLYKEEPQKEGEEEEDEGEGEEDEEDGEDEEGDEEDEDEDEGDEDGDGGEEDEEEDETYDKELYSSYEDYLEKTGGKKKIKGKGKKKKRKKKKKGEEPPTESEVEDKVSNDSTPPESVRKAHHHHEDENFTEFNRRRLKWAVITVACLNFFYAVFTCWQYVMNNALHEFLLESNIINCPVERTGDWLIIVVNSIWIFASFTLLFAENEESASLCLFWLVVKLIQIMTFLYVRIIQLMNVIYFSDHIFEFCWIPVLMILDLTSVVVVIFQYYRLTNNRPVRLRLNKARGETYLNREIWYAGEQEFFQSKHAYRWVCRNQTLKIVEKIEKLRRRYKQPSKNYRFNELDFEIDYALGYNEYRRSYNIQTDVFDGLNKIDFGRFRDDEDLLKATNPEADDDNAIVIEEEEDD